MSTTKIIGKHDVLCSSLNFATPEGAAECDCNLSVMADMLEALESLRKWAVGLAWEPMGSFGDESDWFQCSYCRARSRGNGEHASGCVMTKAANAIAKAKGGAA